jgi:hypothetical protein
MISKKEIKQAQNLIDSGSAWLLEGSVGRHCMGLIEAGYCLLGKVGHRDFWGNYVPSRYEVKSGTKGSEEYVDTMEAKRNDDLLGDYLEDHQND